LWEFPRPRKRDTTRRSLHIGGQAANLANPLKAADATGFMAGSGDLVDVAASICFHQTFFKRPISAHGIHAVLAALVAVGLSVCALFVQRTIMPNGCETAIFKRKYIINRGRKLRALYVKNWRSYFLKYRSSFLIGSPRDQTKIAR
jgi:hypothetical protein